MSKEITLRASQDARTHVSAITARKLAALSLNFVRVHPATPAQWLLLTGLNTSPLAKQVAQLAKRCVNHPVLKAGNHPVGESTTVFKINVKRIDV